MSPRGVGAVRWIAVVALAALVSACAPAAEQPSPSVTAETSVPSTVSTTTTTRSAGPHDICGRALIWQPGGTYVADCFAVPVTFSPAEPGWRSIKVGAEWIELSWVEAGDIGIRLLFLALTPEDPPEEVLDRILTIDGVDGDRQPSATSIAGLDARSAMVETQPRPTAGGLNDRTCASMTHAVDLFAGERPGYLLLDRTAVGSGAAYGLGACLTFGIWTVDVRGLTITVIAATETGEEQTALRAQIDSLMSAVTFGRS